MRVTQDSMVQATLHRLQTRLSEREQANTKVSTGREWQRLSDDPAKANRALGLRAEEHARTQHQRNAESADSLLEITDSTLQSMVDRLHRVRDLTAAGAKGTQSQSEREAIATELHELRDELMALANRTQGKTALFAGYRAEPAVTATGAGYAFSPPPEDDIEQVRRTIGPHEDVRLNVTAQELFTGVPGAGDNLFALIDEIATQVAAGDDDAASASLGKLDTAREQLQAHHSAVGVAHNRVKAALNRGERDLLAIKTERSNVEDVDLAEAIMELQTQEVAYEAALGSLARVMGPSLLDFLR